MNLHCLGSGSSGNCYLLSSETETLVLDCGLPIREIKRGLNWDIAKVVGVLCSHAHSDHAKAVREFENMGIEVFKPYDETIACPLKIRYGSFGIQAFKVPHDGTPNYGFYITVDKHRILYATDFEYCKYVFKNQNINHILIEANHSKELLNREKANYIHSIRGHASINTTCKFLEANRTSHLRTVILVHLSSECGDEKVFKEMAEKVVDCPVYVARAGLEIELKESNCPF